jgi:hypothetical protein
MHQPSCSRRHRKRAGFHHEAAQVIARQERAREHSRIQGNLSGQRWAL